MKSCFGLTRFFGFLSVMLCIVLTGCMRQNQGQWQSVAGAGPQIGPNQAAAIYKQCQNTVREQRQCVWAFEDQDGQKITIPQLIQTIDATLSNTPESQKWAIDAATGKTKLPYHFTILSISPTIVVGHPLAAQATYCENQAKSHYCLNSQKFSGAYEISSTLRFTPNLVWFSPEHGASIFKAPTGTKSVFFVINGTTVRMKRNGNLWLFQRAN